MAKFYVQEVLGNQLPRYPDNSAKGKIVNADDSAAAASLFQGTFPVLDTASRVHVVLGASIDVYSPVTTVVLLPSGTLA